MMRESYVEMLRSGGGVKRPAEDQNSSGSKKNKIQEEELDMLMEENKKLEVRMKCMENLCKMMRESYVEMLRSGGGGEQGAGGQDEMHGESLQDDEGVLC